ncbi:MAG: phosphoribosylanthranilate isomerase [Candidatus Dormibacteria bacterium]
MEQLTFPANPGGALSRAAELGAGVRGGRTRVKICGCTSAAEVTAAVAAGADAVGLIFAPSPRRITLEQAVAATSEVPPGVTVVGVFVDPTVAELDFALTVLPTLVPQFSGVEPPELCRYLGVPYLKVFPVAADRAELESDLMEYPDALPVFETASPQRGGSGRTFDWSLVQPIAERGAVVIGGGLTPGNVGDCVRRLRPYAVDVRSGVESQGAKDPVKLGEFLAAVRSADAAS